MRLRLPAAGLALCATAFAATPVVADSVYAFDETGSQIRFVVRHGVLSLLKGSFGEFDGEVTIDPDNLEGASVVVTIRTASIDTGLSFVDGHLRSPVLFDVQQHPTMTFHSRRVDVADSKSGRVLGDLTLLGITHPVVLEVTLEGMDGTTAAPPSEARFKVTGTMNRAAFGMDWGPSGFAEDVDIHIEVAAQRL